MTSNVDEIKALSLEKRKEYSADLMRDNPLRVPILVSSENGKLKLKTQEFLVPKQLKIIHFTATLRRSMNLDPENAIYLYIDNHMIKQDRHIAEIYDQYKNEDGFLYINVTDIPALGN
jgi:GABA(A) receptor-associated protein